MRKFFILLLMLVVSVGGVFCSFYLFEDFTATNLVFGTPEQYDPYEDFTIFDIDLSEDVFYQVDDQYKLKKEYNIATDFNGSKNKYSLLFNNNVCMVNKSTSGTLYSQYELSFYDIYDNVLGSVSFDINFKFYISKTVVEISTSAVEENFSLFLEEKRIKGLNLKIIEGGYQSSIITNTATVNIHFKDEDNIIETDTVVIGKKIDYAPTITKDGYNFVSWYCEENSVVYSVDEILELKPKEDLTFSAIWKKLENDVYFHECFTQLEYIKSTGKEYIDTGINASSDIYFNMSYNLHTALSTTSYYLFGARTSTSNGYFLSTYNYDYDGAFRYVEIFDGCLTVNKKASISFYRTYDSTNSTFINKYNGNSIATTNFDLGVNLYLFSCNYNGSFNPVKMSLYSFEILRYEEVIRKFVPVRRNSDGELGLFDLVEYKFYSSPTGDFEAGPEVSNVLTTYIVDNEVFETSCYVPGFSSEAFVTPSDPVKEGYRFVGWSKDQVNIVDVSTVFTEDTILYAMFSKTITVSFIGPRAISSGTSLQYEFDVLLSTKEIVIGTTFGDFPVVPDTILNTYFDGWYYGNQRILSSTICNFSEDIELVAKYVSGGAVTI